MSEWCDKCSNQGSIEEGPHCEIINMVYNYDIEDEKYPDEWCFDEQGIPCCTRYNIGINEHTAKARELREKLGQLRLF